MPCPYRRVDHDSGVVRAEFPDPESIRAALTLATRAPSAHNSRPWRWRVGAAGLHLDADPPRTDPDGRDTLLGCGAALHHCTVALASMGWRARVHRLPDAAEPGHLASIELRAQQPDELDITLAAAISRRRTDRRRYRSWPVPWGDIALMGARAARAGVMLRQIDEIPLLNTVAAEPSQSHPGEDNAVILALGTEEDDAMARLRAGEATSLVLLSATAMGLATCLLTEPLEVPATREAVRVDVFGSSGHPQMMMRVGWAEADVSG